MLPPFEICRDHLERYKQKLEEIPRWRYYENEWGNFQEYKQGLETGGHSILDDQHVAETAEHLKKFLDAFGACRPGEVVEKEKLELKLRKIGHHYENIQCITLGEGRIYTVRESLRAAYAALYGVSTLDSDGDAKSLVVPKSKALMAIWGQTPGFDKRVRYSFYDWRHHAGQQPLIHVRKWGPHAWRYSSEEFADMVEQLDQWVLKWPGINGGKAFSSLDPKRPVGRIIDIIYWSHKDQHPGFSLHSEADRRNTLKTTTR